MRATHLSLAVAFAAAFALAPAAVTAQDAPAPPDSDELTTFAEAFVEISVVRQEMMQRIPEAESPEEAAEIQEEANQEMLGVLEDHELEADRYNEITQLLNADEELRARFEEIYAALPAPN